jgi:uncharacterized protein (DUF305 family)
MKAVDWNKVALLLGGLLLGVGLTLVAAWPALMRSESGTAGAATGFVTPMMGRMGMSDMGMSDMGMGGMGMMGGQNGMGMMGEVDRHFIVMMIPHHQDAIDMADLALRKAQHPELKALAADIKRVQADEIERMREWYRDWYGIDVPSVSSQPARPGSGMMGGQNGMGIMDMMGGDLDTLSNAEDFDKAFISMMVPHHRMALMMSNMVIMGGEHKELRDLARSIITSQSAEIERMEEWYTAWYEN